MKFRRTTPETIAADLRAFAAWLEHEDEETRRIAASELNEQLDTWRELDSFGTEGQCDPRGDHRESATPSIAMGIVEAAAARFDAHPLHRASIEAQAELRAEQELSAIACAGLDHAALLLGKRGVHASSLTDVLTVADDHIRALLQIIDRTGGFTSPADQETIRAARKAVSRG